MSIVCDELDEVSSDLLFDKDNTPHEDGLLSQRIFGPNKNYKCKCGEYSSKVLYNGKRCPKCKVLCSSSDDRSKVFAKISLQYPVYRLSKLTQLSKLTTKKYSTVLNPKLRDMSTSTEAYLEYDTVEGKLSIVDNFNPNNSSSRLTIPFPIIGTYSLYISLLVASELGSTTASRYITYFQFEIPVVPPNSRPSIISNGNSSEGKFIHELDQLYIKLIHKRNYLKNNNSQIDVLDVDSTVSMILNSMSNIAPVSIDDMIMHEFEQCTLQYYTNDIYSTTLDILSGKEGLVRNEFLGKIIDFSARAVISPNSTILPYQIKIPMLVFIKLWFIEYLWYLAKIEDVCIDNAKEIMRNADGIKQNTNFIDEFASYFFENSEQWEKLIFINRQPTLWRYGAPAVEVVGISNGDTIETNPIFLDPLNGDYDGDTVALYRIHDKEALHEMQSNAFILNTIKYDHNSTYLHTLKDETVYYLKVFTETSNSEPPLNFGYDDVILSIDYISVYDSLVIVDDDEYTVGTCLVNIAAGFNSIHIKPGINKNDVSKLIYRDSANNEEYFSRLSRLSNFLNNAGLIIPEIAITLPIEECAQVNNFKNDNEILTNLPKHPIIGYLLYKSAVANIVKRMDPSSSLTKFRETKFKEIQFARSLVNVGYVSDHNNITSGEPITNSTFGGLTEDEFFRTAYGARKGITDKEKVVPDSGYLERSMVMNFSAVEISEDDCGTKFGFPITIKNRQHAKSLVGRFYSTTSNSDWVKLDPEYSHMLVGKDILLRSPITCVSPHYKICKKCFGDTHTPGPFVGILAGQYIAERMTQLAMRTFHTSGSATYSFSKNIIDFFAKHITKITKHSKTFTLSFDTDIPQNIKYEIKEKCKGTLIDDKSSNRALVFEYLDYFENEDVTTILKIVEDQFKSSGANNETIVETYYAILMNMLSLGYIHSVFVEIAICNSFLTKSEKVFRYSLKDNIDNGTVIKPIHSRMNVRSIHNKISPLLSLLYVPNAKTIHKIDASTSIGFARPPEITTIYERIWLSEL